MDFIKINVDRSLFAEPKYSGIGGLLRDHYGNLLLHFAKEVLIDSAILIEIHAIREGLLVAAASHWLPTSQFLIESDSANVVAWFKNSNSAPWMFRNINRESIQHFGRHISWTILHIRRTGNDAADVLACIGALGASLIDFV